MNQSNRPKQQTGNTSQQPQLTPEIVQALLQNQQIEAQNEANRIRLREREIDVNAKFASESLKANVEFLNGKPSQDRKTIFLYSGIAAFFVLVLIGFIVYLIEAGQKDIVTTVIKGVGLVVTHILTFFLGKNQGQKPKPPSDDSTNAEVVE